MRKISFTLLSMVWGVAVFGQATNIKSNVMIFGGVEVNNRVVFATGNGQLCITDATAVGTAFIDAGKVLLDFNGLSAGIGQNKFFFTGINDAQGSELWVTDGTEAGTKIVKDILPGSGGAQIEAPNDRGNFPLVNSNIYFVANDGVNGKQLWKSDGTEAGTQLVKVIRAGADPQIRFPEVSDSNFYAGDDFYFMANDGINGLELWKTNGTAAGTSMVADITTGPASTVFGSGFVSLCGTLLFTANNGQTGMELWKTNGNQASTVQLRDIAPGSLSAFRNNQDQNFNSFTFESKIYFTVFEGGAESWQNEQMWVTDGSPAGTKAVTNMGHMMSGGFHAQLNNESYAAIKHGRFYFMVNDYENSPLSLWCSDGTTSGTQLVKIINNVPPDWGNPNYQRPLGRLLMPFEGFSEDQISQVLFKGNFFFMMADDGIHKRQLWISDGTADGTQMLVVNPNGHGIDSSEYLDENFSFRLTESHIYFPGITASNGMELWRSDGTQAGTSMVYDAWPGTSSSLPIIYGISNGRLIFHAKNGGAPNPNLYRLDAQVIDYTSGGMVYLCPGGTTVLRSNVTGTSMVWQVNTPSGWINLPEGGNFIGTNSSALVLANMPSTAFGWEFRCVADGNLYSNSYRIVFVAYWVGEVNSEWENPANWYCGAVPDSNTIAVIQCQYGNTPVITTNVQCRTLQMTNKQSLYVAPGGRLTITHNDQGD